MRGERYDINGFKFLCIGGAESHDAQYRIYGESIWLQESITKEQIERPKIADSKTTTGTII